MSDLLLKNYLIQRQGKVLCEPVSITLDKGSVILITGANGIGKSTALRNMAGLSGKAIADNLYYLGHSLPLHSQLSVVEQLSFYNKLYQPSAESSFDTIYNFLNKTDDKVFSLSAGQKQRLALAACWYNLDKPIWLLDEPLTALDEISQQRFLELCQSYLDKGGIVIAAVHHEAIWQQFFPDLTNISLLPAKTQIADDSW